MNDHPGWSQDGKCVWCFTTDSSKPCLDLSPEDLIIRVINLQQQIRLLEDERNWWQKKHKEDCLTMRIIGRREGAQEMKSRIRDLIWDCRSDDFLDSEISSLDYKEDHAVNCNWWKDWHDCNCRAFDNDEND